MHYILHLLKSLADLTATYIPKKNVTYNIALESTTYAKLNVTLGVTLLHGNITFVRLAPTPAQRTGAGLILAVLNF